MRIKSVKIILTMSVLAGFLSYSCGVEDINNELLGCNTNWLIQVEPALNEITATSTAFQNEPTQANCENHSAAWLNYIDELEDVLECVPENSQQDFDEALEEARTGFNNVDCTDF